MQALAYPALDASMSTPSAARSGALVEHYLVPYLAGRVSRHHPYVSPLLENDLTGMPASVLATVEHDPLRDEGRRFAARLSAAGVSVVATHYPTLAHGFLDTADLIDAHRSARQEFLRATAQLWSAATATSETAQAP